MAEPDFSGYATKFGIECSDGRTIMHEAFKQHDSARLPLVWQHSHDDPNNVLGHVELELRHDGMYSYGFFNDTVAGQNAKKLVKHGDVNSLSIFANRLIHKGKNVVHGVLKEVSLVLAGANPGAFIDYVNLAHSGDDESTEAVIYSGFEFGAPEDTQDELENLEHAATEGADVATATQDEKKTVKDVFESMTEEQQSVVMFMVGEALSAAQEDQSNADPSVQHADDTDGESVQHADDTTDGESVQHTDIVDEAPASDVIQHEETNNMTTTARNVFEGTADAPNKPTLSHSDLKSILTNAQKIGSFKEAFLAHAEEQNYGVQDIEFLFPDARTLSNSPELIARRSEWVAGVINGTKHSPFSRIKSIAADITADEARAKGYVKASLKKEEVVKLLKRVTTPTTIYKKQKLDRDDIIDITDLDVVAWLKAEMRLMLDEELARAILLGDGREPDDEDKINEDNIRPIAFDDEMYAHQISVASNISPESIVESVLRSRTYYKGTGTPTFYTTDQILTDLILIKDKIGRRVYQTEVDLAAALRVKEIVVVEAMESVPDLLGVVVNISDYTIGADRGGSVSMFDDFDIDYNQYKYLIETRVSGALTKPKSAVVIKRVSGTTVSPVVPTYDPTTHTITIPTTGGVEYTIGDEVVTGAQVITETTDVEARPAAGYNFPHNTDADWTYVYTA